MADVTMITLTKEMIPTEFGTAVQEDADKPVFSRNGPDDYFCATCGNLLAEKMPPGPMRKVRIKCAKCETINGVEVPKV
jgi:LSD1 subclass zinc finger protein